MGRQHRLGAPGCPELWVVLEEAVLKRPIGGSDVMRAQLERLVEAAAERHIKVQVLPFSQGAHDVMGGPLTVLTLPDGSEVAYTDRLRADALPTVMSLDMIRSAMEGYHPEANVPSRSERLRLAQEQHRSPQPA